jgi:hypothetical protein
MSTMPGGVHAHHLAYEPEVHFFAVHHGPRPDCAQQAAVFSGHAHGVGAVRIDQSHQFASHLAGEDHPDHVHGFRGGHAEAALEFGFNAEPAEHRVDLRASAVDHHRVDAYVVEEHDVLGEGAAEIVVDHGVAAVLDHHDGAGEPLDPGQGLNQGCCLVLGVGHAGGFTRLGVHAVTFRKGSCRGRGGS